MNRLLVTILVSLVSLLCVTSSSQVKSDSLTPEIAVTQRAHALTLSFGMRPACAMSGQNRK
jgi:hypothetical protein